MGSCQFCGQVVAGAETQAQATLECSCDYGKSMRSVASGRQKLEELLVSTKDGDNKPLSEELKNLELLDLCCAMLEPMVLGHIDKVAINLWKTKITIGVNSKGEIKARTSRTETHERSL